MELLKWALEKDNQHLGYKLTHESIVKVVRFLDQMKDSEDTLTWNVPPNTTPDRVAYELRQGMRAALHLGYNQYNNLIEKYVIRARAGKLIAERRASLPVDAFKQSMSRMVLEEIVSLSELIGATIKHEQDEMYFPAVNLDDGEKLKLEEWLRETNRKYVTIQNDKGITLTRTEEPLIDIDKG